MIFGHGRGFGDDFDYQAFIFGNDNQDGDELHGDLIQVIMTYKLLSASVVLYYFQM